ncbi:MAG: Na+:H+ antiporter, NhaA family [Actinomycetota bacterium]|nr:Na+:H+ antiporter, NhaA family [Actinomycetota bacterium]
MRDRPDLATDGEGSGFLRAARDPRAAGLAMALATVAALVWANTAAESYRTFWLRSIAVPGLRLSAQEWVDQGLMVAFFVVVGLEMRREIAGGELRSWRHAAVPVGAALGGMAVPAVLYVSVVHGGAGSHGWGIPMATDVAFALGALALVATHASARLRVFLLTLAVADDIASIAVLVCFYSRDVRLSRLLAAAVCLAIMVVVQTSAARSTALLAAIGALAWWALVHAGVEASVVGVAIGLLAAPVGGRDRNGRRAERRRIRSWEHLLEPWVNALVLPLFALANVGVTLAGSRIFSGAALGVFVAVLIARVVGKPLGVAGAALAITRGSARHKPRDLMHLRPRDRVGLGALASVGFTVPLLIVHAALPPGPLAAAATCALLAGSVLGAVGGAIVLRQG